MTYLLTPLAQNNFSKKILNLSTRLLIYNIEKLSTNTHSNAKNNLCHRDIKPQNISYDDKANQFYLCYFDEVIKLE